LFSKNKSLFGRHFFLLHFMTCILYTKGKNPSPALRY
jgi:hypothetical protein